jgi:WD40 repeat protein
LDRHTNDWREFTWSYVNRLCQSYRQPYLKATNAIFALATTRDGSLLAAAGGFDFVTVWDLKAQTDRPLQEFRAGGLLAGMVCFSPDGRDLVTSGLSSDRNPNGLQIWDTTTWQRVTNFSNLPGRFCDFSPDGKLLAIPSGTDVVLLKVEEGWKELRRLTNHTGAVWSARFSKNGTRLVTGSGERTARVWDTTSWETIAVLTNTDGGSVALFSPDGQRIATAGQKTVRLWDVNPPIVLGAYTNKAGVIGLDFSPDGRFVASGGSDGLVKLWDWKSNTLRELRGHSRMVTQVKFVLDGTKLASASWDGMIRLWDLQEKPPNDVLQGQTAWVPPTLRSPFAFSSDGLWVATASSNFMEILLWDTVSGTRTGGLYEAGENGTFLTAALAFSSRDGMLAAARLFDTARPEEAVPRIEFWDVRRRAITNSFTGQAPICFSPDGHWFASQGTNSGTIPKLGTIQFRDMKTGDTRMSQGGFELSPDQNEFAFSPDGRFLATSGIETVLWETATGRRVATVVSAKRDMEEPIRTVAFTADSRWLIGAGTTGEIQVWEVATRQRVCRIHAHLTEITHLAISPDGKTLATGGELGLIKLWRLEPPDGHFSSRWAIRELLTLSEHHAAIVNLQFSPNGNVLGSSDADGVVRLWRADPTLGSENANRKTRQLRETSQ